METYEDFAYVIDYLPYGKSADKIKVPVAYTVGEQQFKLLEVVPKRNVELKINERVYVGKDLQQRVKIEKIRGRVDYNEISNGAKENLPLALKQIILNREKYFVNFYNSAKPLNIRMHQIQLLPGIGKKHLEDFLAEREKKPFESFADIKERISMFPDPVNALVQRIITEMTDKSSRYYFFVRPPFNQLNSTK